MIDINEIIIELEQEYNKLKEKKEIDYSKIKLQGYKDAISDLKIIVQEKIEEIFNC